jgi:hypothetical protein
MKLECAIAENAIKLVEDTRKMADKNNELYNDTDFDIFVDGELDSFDYIMAAEGECRLEDGSIPQSDIEWERERWNSVYNSKKAGKFDPEAAQEYAEWLKAFREWEKKLLESKKLTYPESKKLTYPESKRPTYKYFPDDFELSPGNFDDIDGENDSYDNIPF